MLNSNTKDYLHIVNCATLLLNDKDYHIERPNGRSDYLLIFMAKGKGYITIENEKREIKEKQAFIFHPYESQSYHFYKKDNSINYWVHFDGNQCDNIIKSLNLDKINILITNNTTIDIEQMFYRLCHEYGQKSPFYEQVCSGLLLTILSLISRSVYDSHLSKKPSGYIEQIIGEFRSDPNFSLSVESIAQKFSISPNHLIREFKKTTGLTPTQYMIDNRLAKAKELLLFSNSNIAEIAETIGYQNSAYFSRLFKKHVGVSPLDFRANAKTNSH